jgi:hypothetical protein
MLHKDQAEYIMLQWRLLRQANRKAADYSRKWNAVNEEVNQWMADHNITDLVQQVRIKEQNLTLQGHLASWSFWEREAKRILGAIHGEWLCMELLGNELDKRTPYQRTADAFFPGG